MKKTILYLSVFAVAATALYYGSYRLFYTASENEVVKEKEEENRARTLLQALVHGNDDGSGDNTEESAQAMQSGEFIVTRTTEVVMEYYDKKSGRTTYENLNNNTELLGYDREQVMQHTKDYMNNMSVEDEEKGLYDYQLIAFADNKITLRKYYDTPAVDENKPKFYVGILDYMIVIYCNDEERTVYEITDIDSRLLPSSVANQLSEGMYFYEEYDLYNFLEAYSS